MSTAASARGASNGWRPAGVWHTASAVGDRNLKGFQVWMLLPPGADLAAPASVYLDAGQVPGQDGVRVILGEWNGLSSPLPGVPEATLVDVTLQPGAAWRYVTPGDHDLAWIAVYSGSLEYAAQTITAGELMVLDDGAADLEFDTRTGAGFLLGSARRSSQDLHVGRSSVHGSAQALATGEAEIARLGVQMQAAGLIR